MTPQELNDTETAGAKPAAVLLRPEVMKKRADFVRTASALRFSTQAFNLQARNRNDDSSAMRVGFTCSKKVGNAVARNRAKRRLREIARLVLPEHGRAGWDYVLIGRRDYTAAADFQKMKADLIRALRKMHS